MKFKLDENIGKHAADVLITAGHDVSTVLDQGLSGAPDRLVFEVCIDEGRTLVTLDRDFGQVLRFPPTDSAGIVILDLGPKPNRQKILERMHELASLLASGHELRGRLWIVEPGRVRIHGDSGAD